MRGTLAYTPYFSIFMVPVRKLYYSYRFLQTQTFFIGFLGFIMNRMHSGWSLPLCKPPEAVTVYKPRRSNPLV
jgi:hypothetical protein